MSKHIFGAFVIVFIISLTASQAWAANANVVENPGFESPTDGSPWAGRWCSFTTTTSQKYSGTRSGLATGRTATWQGIEQDMMGKMVIGQTYTISAWVRIAGATSATVNVSFERVDDRGTQYPSVRSVTANSSNWVQIPATNWNLDVVGTLSTLKIYFQGPGSGVDIYVDDVSVYGPVPAAPDPNASADVNFSTVYQELEGFGAAGGWYENWLTAHPNKAALYDILFGQLGLDIYRLRNTYDQNNGADYMSRSGEIVAAAGTSLGHPIKILISAWSPPAYLKSNDSISGGDNATLAGGPSAYVYPEFADWWADSITAWAGYGINADYISMQNEPDYDASWDSCRFNPTENSSVAGYNQAFEAVYNELYSRFGSSMPKMLAPEATGFNGASGSNLSAYLSAIINHSHVYGYAHHLYNINAGDNPDAYLSAMQSFNSSWGSKPLFQTEYEKSTDAWPDALNLALLLHNSLTVEEVSGYLYWDLFWGGSGGLVTLPSYGSSSYTINSDYYGLKHYSVFTDPGWHRVDATDDSDYLRMSAYKSPDDSNMSIVIINTSDVVDINLTLSLGSVTPESSEIYRSTSGSYWSYVGTLNLSTPLLVPKSSVTTIHLTATTNYSTCAEAIAAGYRLYSDMTLDCYVDIEDLDFFVERWLRDDCGAGNNFCDLADFDESGSIVFSDFAWFGDQWMTCNDPQDSNCTQNWP